jgi:hypothetical protein
MMIQESSSTRHEKKERTEGVTAAVDEGHQQIHRATPDGVGRGWRQIRPWK